MEVMHWMLVLAYGSSPSQGLCAILLMSETDKPAGAAKSSTTKGGGGGGGGLHLPISIIVMQTTRPQNPGSNIYDLCV